MSRLHPHEADRLVRLVRIVKGFLKKADDPYIALVCHITLVAGLGSRAPDDLLIVAFSLKYQFYPAVKKLKEPFHMQHRAFPEDSTA